MGTGDSINRDVGPQAKGARLQRLRAALLILNAIVQSASAHVYCAVEHEGDVYLKNADSATELHEEDKNYDPDKNFTLMSEQVRNTLLIFLECWIKKGCSNNVFFGFYTTANIAKERDSETSTGIGVIWPDRPVLEYARENNFGDSGVADCFKRVITQECQRQYGSKDGNLLKAVATWSQTDWETFLARIEWAFGAPDERTLWTSLVEKVRAYCKDRDFDLRGMEESIVSCLINLIDDRQSNTDPTERFVHAAEVRELFLLQEKTTRDLGFEWAEKAVAKAIGHLPAADGGPAAKHEILVREIRQHLDGIRNAIQLADNDVAASLAESADQWLNNHGTEPLPNLLAELYVEMALVATIQAKHRANQRERIDLGMADTWLSKARQAGCSSAEVMARIDGLTAYLLSLKGNPDAGLALIEGRTDPESVKRRLGILIDCGRWDKAVNLLDAVPNDPLWIDKAVLARLGAGDAATAKTLIQWISGWRDHRIMWQRSIAGYIEHTVGQLAETHARQPGRPSLASTDLAKVQDALDVAAPIVHLIDATESVDNGLQAAVLDAALCAWQWQGRIEEIAARASWLAERKPIPWTIIQLIGSRTIPCDAGIPDRIRRELPLNFEAMRAAALIEGDVLNRPVEAYAAAAELARSLQDQQERDDLCRVLLHLGHLAGPGYLARARESVSTLLSEHDRLRRLSELEEQLASGSLVDAAPKLEEIRDEDDPYWLQLKADHLIHEGNERDAVGFLEKAAAIVRQPVLFKRVAAIAFKNSMLDVAQHALEEVAKVEPDSKATVHNLAMIYVKQGDWRRAAQQFHRLKELEPKQTLHALNEALALASAGEEEDSLGVYNELCSETKPILDALLGRAQLFRSMGRPDDAFKSLKKVRPQFWQVPRYVAGFMDFAYSAGADDLAQEAMAQLLRIQKEESDGNHWLQAKSMDDLREEMRKWRERTDFIAKSILEGRRSWLMAEGALNNALYWGWLVRTQSLAWVGDDPLFVAQRCIYATHGFVARPADDGRLEMQDIACPPKGAPIAIDFSAMITLDQLGLLEKAAEYFGKVFYPSSYHARRLEERAKLIQHQPSRRIARERIRDAVDDRRIEVVQETANTPGLAVVREHTHPAEETSHFYRLRDVLNVLTAAGAISAELAKKMRAVAHRDAGADKKHPALSPGQIVLMDVSTLETLSVCDCLDAALTEFRICVRNSDYNDLVGDLSVRKQQDDVLRWFDRLWETIAGDARFVEALYRIPDSIPDYDRSRRDAAFAAPFLAQTERVPLLADDRACQTLMANERKDAVHAAFGTDRLLPSLAEAGLLTWVEAAGHLLRLIEWRYRFVLPVAEMLVAMALEFRHALPGRDLLKVAGYVHDCMRDPGLFGGLEKTDPPTSMAYRLFFGWTGVISESVALVWMSDDFDGSQREAYTEWAMREFLPSAPRSSALRAEILCELTPTVVLSRVMLRLMQTDDHQRGHECLQAVARGLGLSFEALCEKVTEAIDGI